MSTVPWVWRFRMAPSSTILAQVLKLDFWPIRLLTEAMEQQLDGLTWKLHELRLRNRFTK